METHHYRDFTITGTFTSPPVWCYRHNNHHAIAVDCAMDEVEDDSWGSGFTVEECQDEINAWYDRREENAE